MRFHRSPQNAKAWYVHPHNTKDRTARDTRDGRRREAIEIGVSNQHQISQHLVDAPSISEPDRYDTSYLLAATSYRATSHHAARGSTGRAAARLRLSTTRALSVRRARAHAGYFLLCSSDRRAPVACGARPEREQSGGRHAFAARRGARNAWDHAHVALLGPDTPQKPGVRNRGSCHRMVYEQGGDLLVVLVGLGWVGSAPFACMQAKKRSELKVSAKLLNNLRAFDHAGITRVKAVSKHGHMIACMNGCCKCASARQNVE
ncbi:hypothetical protein GUJ93_ZPchr0001g31414 [Zizania palustris]|uniref:Uncharacterized protein n=1 Tax=Zizania palustris TaxID=103762 RepID=A0A8J5V8G7_ZIZPA|nr:hypothetical protein GUJ93_ZPchr0001g31414 [Zizania palustris]